MRASSIESSRPLGRGLFLLVYTYGRLAVTSTKNKHRMVNAFFSFSYLNKYYFMKNYLLKTLFLCLFAFAGTTTSAQTFEVDGIYYSVISSSALTCKVESSGGKYAGNIVIPATVNYNEQTFSVVEISKNAFYLCSGFTGITIPNTISRIDDGAFNGCI